MPAPLLHLGATVTCSHGGQAAPSAPTPRVLVCGQPAVPIASPYTVVGCPFAPSAGNGPCASGQWLTGTVRVLSAGQPLALMTGQSLCVPTGTPLLPLAAQTRVLVT